MMDAVATGLKRSTERFTIELHISGGLRAWPVEARGLVLTPANGRHNGGLHFPSFQALAAALKPEGLQLLGEEVIGSPRGYLQSRLWKPIGLASGTASLPGDAWSSISHHAKKNGDDVYSALARNISLSIHAAGLRLRDASAQYRKQFLQALKDGHEIGDRFTNIELFDLHLALHSIASELCSARDYLASILGIHHHAPPKIDSMNRFIEWAVKPAQAAVMVNPLVAAIIEASEVTSANPWLWQLTEIRNAFTHRQPARSAARLLSLEEHRLVGVVAPTLTMPFEMKGIAKADSLHRFIELYRRMSDLLGMVATQAAYPSTPPTITVKSAGG